MQNTGREFCSQLGKGRSVESSRIKRPSLDDLSHQASGHGSSSFTTHLISCERGGTRSKSVPDIEALASFDGNRMLDFAEHFHIIPWHDHLAGIFRTFGPVESGSFVYGTG